MNFKTLTILVLASNVTCAVNGMEELPALPKLNQEAIRNDKLQLVCGLDVVNGYYGIKKFDIGSPQEIDLFLQKFKGSWQGAVVAPLGYTFESYMKQAGIDAEWMESEEKFKTIKSITVSEFVTLVWKRFDEKLAKYTDKN